jgi:hypothetical protein
VKYETNATQPSHRWKEIKGIIKKTEAPIQHWNGIYQPLQEKFRIKMDGAFSVAKLAKQTGNIKEDIITQKLNSADVKLLSEAFYGDKTCDTNVQKVGQHQLTVISF